MTGVGGGSRSPLLEGKYVDASTSAPRSHNASNETHIIGSNCAINLSARIEVEWAATFYLEAQFEVFDRLEPPIPTLTDGSQHVQTGSAMRHGARLRVWRNVTSEASYGIAPRLEAAPGSSPAP